MSDIKEKDLLLKIIDDEEYDELCEIYNNDSSDDSEDEQEG
jgi:hypothetical protein